MVKPHRLLKEVLMSEIKAVLFDLDGTLLPLDQDVFAKKYFNYLTETVAPHFADAKKIIKIMLAGMDAMVKNDGSKTNKEVFFETAEKLGGKDLCKEPLLFGYYDGLYLKLKDDCRPTAASKKVVSLCKNAGLRTVLATNPVFPAAATIKRMGWAGLSPDDFEFITAFENSRFCKPNIKYYEEILGKLGLSAEECLMVGNDVDEDMTAKQLGIKVFLLSDCIVNRENKDVSEYPRGGFAALEEFLKKEEII